MCPFSGEQGLPAPVAAVTVPTMSSKLIGPQVAQHFTLWRRSAHYITAGQK